MLPRLLIKELMVSFDSTAIVSAVPSAGSLEACRLQHVGTAVCVREQRPLAVLLAQTAMQPAHRAGALVSPLEPWALGSWELFASLDFSYSPSCNNTPGVTELFELTSMDEPGFQAGPFSSPLLIRLVALSQGGDGNTNRVCTLRGSSPCGGSCPRRQV